MKHFILLILFISIAVPVNPLPAAPEQEPRLADSVGEEPRVSLRLTEEEARWLADHPVIRVGGPRAFPPFEYIGKDGEIQGMASDYLEMVSQRMGVRFDFQKDLPWPEVLRRARTRELDLISCAARTAERETYLGYGRPYLSFPLVIISRKDGAFIGGLEDLHGKTVVFIREESSYSWMKRDGIRFAPLFADTPLDALKAVEAGRADAHIANLANASYLIETHGLEELKIAAPAEYGNYDLGFAARKDWPLLISILDKALDTIRPEEHAAIRNRWITVRYLYGVPTRQLATWGLAIGVPLILIVMITLFWNRRLQGEIRERRQAETALRASEQRFRAIFNAAEDSIFLKNPDQSYRLVNPSMARLFNMEAGRMQGMFDRDLFDEIDIAKIREEDERVLSGETVEVEARAVIRGGRKLFHLVKVPIYGGPDKIIGICGIARDITQRNRLERQAEEIRKMEAVATLAGGIAHEFNNLLMGVQGRVSLMRLDTPPSHPHFVHLQGLEEFIRKATSLTRRLLGFARGEAYAVKPIDMNQLIREQNRLFGAARKEITIRDELAKDLRAADADATRIERVLLNLYLNASRAMPDGGVLRVRSENVRVESADRQMIQLKPGGYVKISVSDTGVGMDEETQKRIFDPFFTNRPRGGGTGLGLASVYGIIKNHGGRIEVFSEIGKGTTFCFYLPTSDTAAVNGARMAKTA